jgi:hypothetical protein
MQLLDSRVFMTNICCVKVFSEFGGVSVLKLLGAGSVFFFSFFGFLFLNAIPRRRSSRGPGLVARLASPEMAFRSSSLNNNFNLLFPCSITL